MKKLNANKKINNFKNNDRKKKPVINLSKYKKSNYIITKNVSSSKSSFQRNIKRNNNILKYSSEEKNEYFLTMEQCIKYMKPMVHLI